MNNILKWLLVFTYLLWLVVTVSANAGQVAGSHASSEAEREAIGIQRNAQMLQTAMNITQMQNIKLANYSQNLQKDMWNYTNYENQIKNLKAAGLNPALMYAKKVS